MGWLISGLLAGITYVYPDQIREFIDSFLPNAGYYIVRIVLVGALLYFFGTLTYEGYKWIGQKWPKKPTVAEEPKSMDFPDVMNRIQHKQKLEELENGLAQLVSEPARTFMQSGDNYIGKIQFRQQVVKYDELESDAEALLRVDHEKYYLNPDLLEASKQGVARLTNVAHDLLVVIKEYRQRTERVSEIRLGHSDY